MLVHFFIVQPFMTPVQSFSQTKNFGELHRRALGGAMFSEELARATGSCLHDDPPARTPGQVQQVQTSTYKCNPQKAFWLRNQLLLLTSFFWRVRITFITMLATSESYKTQLPETSCIFLSDPYRGSDLETAFWLLVLLLFLFFHLGLSS